MRPSAPQNFFTSLLCIISQVVKAGSFFQARKNLNLDHADLELLYGLSSQLSACEDVELALHQTVPLLAEYLGASSGWVWLLDSSNQFFYCAYSYNLPPYLREPVHMTGTPCWCIQGFQNGQREAKNMSCSRLNQASVEGREAQTDQLKRHASVTISCRGRALGIFNLAAPQGRDLEKLSVLESFAAQVGLALERSRLHQEATLLAREQERDRLARELHDTLTQNLTAVALQLEAALKHFEVNPLRVREWLGQALEGTRESLEQARGSLVGLRCAELEGRPLEVALLDLTRSFTSRSGIRVESVMKGKRPLGLAATLEIELYRLAQEGLSNVARHSQATQARLELLWSRKFGRLLLSDNGRGLMGPKGLGLKGMRERVRDLGGQLRLGSRGGTQIDIKVPLA